MIDETSLRILNTIEFAPYDYASLERDSPDYSDNSDVMWYRYWKSSMADSGMPNLEPIIPRSWLVDINTIGLKESEILVNKMSEKTDFEIIEKSIYGGIVIFRNNEIILSTTCCGDLSDLKGWEACCKEKTEEWKMLWIGHPFVYYRYNEGYIEFSPPTEGSSEGTVDFSIRQSWLHEQITQIRTKQDIFIEKIKTILNHQE